MKLCRFKDSSGKIRTGIINDDEWVVDLGDQGADGLETLLESHDPVCQVERLLSAGLARRRLADVELCAPVERQEVWAAGVTYLRSKTARMEESTHSASAYDRVYDAERPELFFKSLPEKVSGPNDPVGIRRDARWSVPEPELALVLNSRGTVVGYTIGNDMSSRDIEGENLLYLPQAKTYHRSCALGPWIVLAASEAEARQWTIRLAILRGKEAVFRGETRADKIKRKFEELAGFLFRSQVFPHGAVLLTGTGVVPPDQFTLAPDDEVEIEISGIGTLRNLVTLV